MTSTQDTPPATQQGKSSCNSESTDNAYILCGEATHWAKQCPLRGNVSQLIKEGKVVAITINSEGFSDTRSKLKWAICVARQLIKRPRLPSTRNTEEHGASPGNVHRGHCR